MLVAVENWQAGTNAPTLRAGEVHLWRAELTATPELEGVLSSSELIRAGRFHFEQHRQRYMAGRGILRHVLAGYLGMVPRDVRFATGLYGKPALAGSDTSLHFNLSHSDDLMLLAVTYAREIGVDVEFMKDNVPFETLADRYFTPEDAWDLRLLPVEKRAWKFYDVWTCTEARLKASGVGLNFGPCVVEPDRWSLLKLTPAPGYAAALAVEGGDFQLECWSWQR